MLDAYGVNQALSPGERMFLVAGAPHRLSAITDCAVLLTLCLERGPIPSR